MATITLSSVVYQSNYKTTDFILACDVNVNCPELDLGIDNDLPWAFPGQRLIPPLALACLKGDLVMVKLLLSWGADVNAQDIDGCTPAHYLFLRHSRPGWERYRILAHLEACGADAEIENVYGHTALKWATETECDRFVIPHMMQF